MKITSSKKKFFKIGKSVLLVAVIYFVASAFLGIFNQIEDYNQQISLLNEKISEEKQIQKELKSQKIELHSDENYREIARKNLGLVEPGDKVYINQNDYKSK